MAQFENRFRAFNAKDVQDLRRSIQTGIGDIIRQLNQKTITIGSANSATQVPSKPKLGDELYISTAFDSFVVGWYKFNGTAWGQI